MPCLVLTGHPSVGKTSFAKKLGERALQHKSGLISSIEIVNEESVCVDQTKSECYATSHAEKSTRSSLKAKVDRSLNDSTLVICDSLNYIKGYRYELHCLSKAATQRHGVIWVLNAPSVAQEWNRKRCEEKPNYYYTDDQLQELILRYEPPDARNRWDKPLWRVDLSGNSTTGGAQEALQKSVYNMHDLSNAINTTAAATAPPLSSAASSFKKKGAGFKKLRPTTKTQATTAVGDTEAVVGATDTTGTVEQAETPAKATTTTVEEKEEEPKSLEEQIDDILDQFLLNVQPLKEGMSTRQHLNAQSNVLHEVDSLTLQICNAIAAAQQQSYGSSVLTLTEFDNISMNCRRAVVPMTELKRLRKQYVRWVAKNPPNDTSHRGLVESFVRYVEVQVDK